MRIFEFEHESRGSATEADRMRLVELFGLCYGLPRVYETVVCNLQGERTDVIVTMSKEVHLLLGALGQEGRRHLVSLLRAKFCTGNEKELLLILPAPEDGRKEKKGLLVTLKPFHFQGEAWEFHFSAA